MNRTIEGHDAFLVILEARLKQEQEATSFSRLFFWERALQTLSYELALVGIPLTPNLPTLTLTP